MRQPATIPGAGVMIKDMADDEAIQATNDDASECKRYAVQLGYWCDPFISLFVKQTARKAPEINRGYYARVKGNELFVDKFLKVSVNAFQYTQPSTLFFFLVRLSDLFIYIVSSSEVTDVDGPFEKNGFSNAIPSSFSAIAPSALFAILPFRETLSVCFCAAYLGHIVSLSKIKSACQDKRDLLSWTWMM